MSLTIDIISFTDAQFASLTEEQLLQVQSAQVKKNRLDAQLEEKLIQEKHKLIDNGTFLSSLWNLYAQKLVREHEAEVENLRDGLLFYLQYSVKADGSDSSGVFYTPDYSLDMRARYEQVLNAYLEEYETPAERFEAFKADKVALKYLGEYYGTLYQQFALDL